jgi:hypothetical protein
MGHQFGQMPVCLFRLDHSCLDGSSALRAEASGLIYTVVHHPLMNALEPLKGVAHDLPSWPLTWCTACPVQHPLLDRIARATGGMIGRSVFGLK